MTVSGLSNPDKSELFAHSGYFGTQPFVDKDGTDYLVKINGIGSGDNVELTAIGSDKRFLLCPRMKTRTTTCQPLKLKKKRLPAGRSFTGS